MKLKVWICSGLFLVLAGASATALVTQDKKSVKDDPMMKMMMEYATPGPAHKMLEPHIGKWTMKVKMMMPGQPAEESTATSEAKWIMDGRFIQDTTEGSMSGMPFHGMGFTGYDNMKKKYIGTWMDNMGTGIMNTEGTWDAATKTLTCTGECPDMMTGKPGKCRLTHKWTDNDHFTMAMFNTGADGKEAQVMEIQYTRAK